MKHAYQPVLKASPILSFSDYPSLPMKSENDSLAKLKNFALCEEKGRKNVHFLIMSF